ncbi:MULTISPECIES: BON domain-containing protein [Paraburkholderia]|nr:MULTISPECIES: BON domain-containing protein [Paraburkholderia]
MTIRIRILRALLMGALIGASAGAFAQSGAASAGGATTAADATSVKARKAADRKLARRVSTALARTRGLNAARIFVKAQSGHVTLSGSVSDNEQIPLAVEAAKQVVGVSSVENFIHLSGPSL